jgi:heavy metal translocating P-type ATPase
VVGGLRQIRVGLAQKAALTLLIVTIAGLTLGGALHLAGQAASGDAAWLAVSLCGLAYVSWTVVDSLRRRRVGVDVIALLALAGAIAVGELLAGAVISVMLASGRALEAWAAGRARRDLTALLERTPRTARRYRDGSLEQVPSDEIVPGDKLMVTHGDLVPVDGVVAAGSAALDESTLTGEPIPVHRQPGDQVRSGAVNARAPFDLVATVKADESTYAGIVRMVREAEQAQPPFVRLADRYAIWFLLVSLAAAAMALALAGADRAVAVLVVATPCPLILAAPIALVSGMSIAARRGAVVKGGGVLERLARCTTLLLDKTGTLTSGQPAVASVVAARGCAPDQVLALAASLDQASGHVLAAAVISAARGRGCQLASPSQVEEVPGLGIRGRVDGHQVAVGQAAWCGASSTAGTPEWAKVARRRARLDGALTVFVAIDGSPAGVLILDDPVRPDAGRTLRMLRATGIKRIVMVTGDRAEVAESVGSIIGVDAVFAERSPAEKVDAVRTEMKCGSVLMVGDGINDAPALALADVGVAMGAGARAPHRRPPTRFSPWIAWTGSAKSSP